MKIIYSIPLIALGLLAVGAPARAEKMDSQIESSAKKSYVFKTYLQDDDIKIESKDGIVTLTGSVAVNSHKSLAQETVEDLPGVKSVDNKLEVKGAPVAENSDAWLHDKVKITLMFHRSVRATKTEVEVKDGVVTLTGTAKSQAQKELTTQYAMDVDGVKSVNNNMTVSGSEKGTPRSAGQKIDDTSITAQVKMALLFHRSTSAIHTKVTTKWGTVTLGGTAKNTAEKDLVTKLVEDVNGVKNVKNMMTVE